MQGARLRLYWKKMNPVRFADPWIIRIHRSTTYRIEDIIASEQRLEQTQEKLTKIQQQVSANQTLQERSHIANQRMASHQCCCAEASGIRLDYSSTGICCLAADRKPRDDYRGNDEVAELKKRQSFNQQKAASYEDAQKKHQAVNEKLATLNESLSASQ